MWYARKPIKLICKNFTFLGLLIEYCSVAACPLSNLELLCCEDVFKGSAACQQVDSDDEDEEALATDLEEEDALLEAACDVAPPFARSIGLPAFLPLWKVRCLKNGSLLMFM
jgi:hypothetical protein